MDAEKLRWVKEGEKWALYCGALPTPYWIENPNRCRGERWYVRGSRGRVIARDLTFRQAKAAAVEVFQSVGRCQSLPAL